MRDWWHRRRYANCGVCGIEFRKGTGGGLSRKTLCSDACWAEAWRIWLNPTAATAAADAGGHVQADSEETA